MRAPRTALLAVCLLSLPALAVSAAHAAVNPLGERVRVSAGDACGQQGPDVAPLPGGGFVVAWADAGRVLARRFDAAGRPVGEEVGVEPVGAGSQGAPKVATDAAGRFAVVWPDLAGGGLAGRLFSAAGAPLDGSFQVSPQPASGGFDVAFSGDSFLTVIWAEGAIVWSIQLQPDEAPWGGPFPVDGSLAVAGSQPDYRAPALAAVGEQELVAGWSLRDLGLGGSTVQARYLLPWIQPFIQPLPAGPFSTLDVELAPTRTAAAPSVAVEPDGDFAVAWREEAGQGHPAGVFLQHFSASRSPLGPLARVDAGEWRELGSTALSIDAAGLAVVVWEGTPAGAGESGVFARALDREGHPSGPVVRLSEAAGAASPALARLGERGAVAVWQEGPAAEAEASCASGGIVAQRLATSCEDDPAALCLLGGRFRVEVSWEDPGHGTSGAGYAVGLTDQSGYFWFFNQENVELAVKAIDGREVNGKFWLFYGALSDVPYRVAVTDTETGEQRTYRNPGGRLASLADAAAFPVGGTAAAALAESLASRPAPALAPAPATGLGIGPCTNAPTLPPGAGICLNGFAVSVDWRDPVHGTSGKGFGVALTEDSGYFWFFSPGNLELVVKVLDGRLVNGNFWVFSGALTNVEYTIHVRHPSGPERTYHNPPFQLRSFADTGAFTLPGD